MSALLEGCPAEVLMLPWNINVRELLSAKCELDFPAAVGCLAVQSQVAPSAQVSGLDQGCSNQSKESDSEVW